jgi:hypothetical protein
MEPWLTAQADPVVVKRLVASCNHINAAHRNWRSRTQSKRRKRDTGAATANRTDGIPPVQEILYLRWDGKASHQCTQQRHGVHEEHHNAGCLPVRVSEIVNLVRRCYAEITDHCCYFNNNTLSFKHLYAGEPARFFGGNGTRIEPGLVLADPARIKRGNFF